MHGMCSISEAVHENRSTISLISVLVAKSHISHTYCSNGVESQTARIPQQHFCSLNYSPKLRVSNYTPHPPTLATNKEYVNTK